MTPFLSAGVIGAGSWGTALALVLHENGIPVTLWGNDAAHITRMRDTRIAAPYLPATHIPADMQLTSDLSDLRECDLLLVVTPSKAIREVCNRLAAVRPRGDAVLLSCTKGMEFGSGLRMSQIIAQAFPQNPIAVLSGPSHAEEVAKRMATCIVIGAQDPAVCQRLQAAFSTPWFRPYTNDDVAGIELGGALKNIYAIAAGVCDGMGLGDNAKAALITRALVELGRLSEALGAKRETLMGLGGVGDLIVTCFSLHSRNRAVGERLGKGESLEAIQGSMQMVAEGVPTTFSAYECTRRAGVEAPIVEQVHGILRGEISAADALTRLFTRDKKAE